MKWVSKSLYTEKLEKIDSARDSIVRGLSIVIEGYSYHLREEIIHAVQRLKILIDTYGNIPLKSYEKETAAISKLVKELRGEYAGDAELIGLNDWIDDLDSYNQQFQRLTKERNVESMQRTDYRMQTVRKELDPIYYTITENINALIRIEGETVYAQFVEEHNLHIGHYKNIIAQRKGRAAAKRKKKDNKPEESTTNEECESRVEK